MKQLQRAVILPSNNDHHYEQREASICLLESCKTATAILAHFLSIILLGSPNPHQGDEKSHFLNTLSHPSNITK
jgi:hypothetical protein